jgi:hypothetical protein
MSHTQWFAELSLFLQIKNGSVDMTIDNVPNRNSKKRRIFLIEKWSQIATRSFINLKIADKIRIATVVLWNLMIKVYVMHIPNVSKKIKFLFYGVTILFQRVNF